MNRLLTAIAAIFALSIMTTGCGGNSSANRPAADTIAHVTVKQLLETPDSFVNRMFVVEGLCIHACSHLNHDGYIITPGDSDMILKVVPSSNMGGHFPLNLVDSTVTVTGVFREERITDEQLTLRKEQYEVQKSTLPADSTKKLFLICTTAKRYYHTDPDASVPERIDAQREKIKLRKAAEGKDYLSFYYLDATTVK